MLTPKMMEFLTQKQKLDTELSYIANKMEESEKGLARLRADFSEKNLLNRTLERKKYQKRYSDLLEEINVLSKNYTFIRKQSTDLFLDFLKNFDHKVDQLYSGNNQDGIFISSVFTMLKGVFGVGTETMKSIYDCLTYHSVHSEQTYNECIGKLKISLNELRFVLNEYESKVEDICLRQNNDVHSLDTTLSFPVFLESVEDLDDANIGQFNKNELGKKHRELNNYLSDIENSLNKLKEVILHKNIFKAKVIVEQYRELKEVATLRSVTIPDISINDIGYALLET